jgi:polar amino acid transport system substrate-binding protein
MTRCRSRLTSAVATTVGLGMLAACGASSRASDAIDSLGELPTVAPATTEPTATATTGPPSEREQACKDDGLATASYPALDTADGFVAELRSRGRLRVGLDENTQGLSARNPQTGELEGFEVDLAHEIAERLFDDGETAGSVVAVPLVTSEKTDAVKHQDVDITISAVSMSCSRSEDVDFSAEYYTAHQTFLVRTDSDIRERGDLAGRTVCVTTRSSSIGILRSEVPDAVRQERPARTDCLLALQQGEADAYFGHDTFLYGMLEQDPTLEVRELLDPALTVSHYGIAVNRQHRELTRLINFYLEGMVKDGTWAELVCKWLPWNCPDPDQLPVAPTPDYRRES